MTVNGVSGAGGNISAGSLGMSQASDPVSKNLQRQITEAQKKLQELSTNKDLSTEEKMKKRQELQKTISDLNVQLRQHQIDERRAKQQEQESFDDMLGGGQKSGEGNAKGQNSGISQASMEAMISADAAMGQAKIHGSVASKMEGRAGVLKAEIALDAGGPGSAGVVEAKQAELAEVEKTSMNAVSSQMTSLSEAQKAMENADKTEESTEGEKNAENAEKKAEEEEKTADGSVIENAESAENMPTPEIAPVVRYVPVDVRV